MKQKDVFLGSEGDAWFARNHAGIQNKDFSTQDQIAAQIQAIARDSRAPLSVLEIGCGEGLRLAWIKNTLHMTVAGIDPSAKAVEAASRRGVPAVQGTADALPFADGQFDIVIFGFCLYLCDVDDLFRIAGEAHRVLKRSGWIVIQDFYSPAPVRRPYHHKPGIFSHKMDYKRLFDWHPDYTCLASSVQHHGSDHFTDDRSEWVATTVIRKSPASDD
ncbi:class I SAM-dependent methyltransferase [Devosia ginsengisoli]|uniref:class I SAM-dependent methyltransferase n=1 Tax=Devosia ginsengisoli TaxID=400770 RepID=UPI0026E9F119|nr:class I SAM-dependent methyltransferase [Devosia ginsengisoli]MCR6672043.1 class I SAM-dependent methyltransferase [Devosia ginsengisoli]